MRTLLSILLTLGLAASASADDTTPTTVAKGPECTAVTLCDTNLAGDGDCINGVGGDEWVWETRGTSAVTLWADQATATAFTCHLYGAGSGHDAAGAKVTQITVTPLTATQDVVSLSGIQGRFWMRCTGVSGGNAHVVGWFCPVGR